MNKTIIYNKLVRDKIPQIITDSNKTAITKILSDKQYEIALTNKLQEELDEYKEDHDLEELADLQEVINAILTYKNISKEHFDTILDKKRIKRGAFKDRIYLQSVED